MPNREPVVLEGRGYELRLIGPQSVIWPNPSVKTQTYALLNQPALVARKLPMTNNPNSPDMVSGSWTERMNDAGEASLVFPNKEASDGVPWRNRFDGSGRNQWVEIWNENYLDFVGYVEKPDLKRDQIAVGLRGPWFALKAAYERDWVVTQAPRDIVERATQLWLPVVSDNFPYVGSAVPSSQWAGGVQTSGSGVGNVQTGGGLFLSSGATASGTNSAKVTSAAIALQASGVWFASVNLSSPSAPTAVATTNQVTFQINEAIDTYALTLAGAAVTGAINQVSFVVNGTTVASLALDPSTEYSLTLESDGEWVAAHCNGQLIGLAFRRIHTTTTSLQALLQASSQSTAHGGGVQTVVNSVFLRAQQPFLQRGTDKGDYVLPGSASTYPSGGLHARYFNDLDLQSDPNRLFKILSPDRTQISAGNDAAEYANQQDATINFTSPFAPAPGAASTNYSVIWFGAIYLKLSQGNYNISFTTDDGVRVWIGKTKWGDQIIDSWINQGATAYSATLTAASLAGSPSYGGTPVARDGWYPIKIEYFQDTGGANAQFRFTPPASYTDPGGTALTGGAAVIVPATSLSPLGCVDQRHQGVSHFDLVQNTALAFGYQVSAEPYQLETLGLASPVGCFPAQLAPRIREGHDTDAVLEPDDTARAEGLLSYSNTLDAADIVTSLQGNGAGFQSGTTGQLQALVYDPSALQAALFDIQGWQDYSDASFLPLLQGLLNAQLGLRLSPWQVVAGDPIGHPRLANSWPLSAALTPLRWRPGDGLRIYARDINVIDTAPRQLLLVTRQIHPNGATGTQVGFAARPRSAQFALKQTLTQATRWQRNSQRRFAAITGNYEIVTLGAGATDGGSSQIVLMPSDSISSATLRVVVNTGAVAFNVLVNGVDVTTSLNGPWTTTPVQIDLNAVASPDTNCRLFVQLKNNGGVGTIFHYQLLVDVLM